MNFEITDAFRRRLECRVMRLETKLMQMLTLPIKCFWVSCREDEDSSQEFGATQFDEAENYLINLRNELPSFTIELIAEIDA